MTTIVQLEDICVAFGGERIYDHLSFSIRDGEFLCIVGQSGCGKSTLLRVIGDLLKVDSGEVSVGNRPASAAREDIAYVFQTPRLLPWRNAEDNVVLGHSPGLTPPGEDARITQRFRSLPADEQARLYAHIPAGRLANGEDIANAVCFLAAEASGYISGQTITVAGGGYR